MTPERNPDREPFQSFLTNAFLVQQSGIDSRSLSAIVRIQSSIAGGACGFDEAMSLVADYAREVANAAGVAIALLEKDQLVYRAGSGSASARVGRHVTAVLSASEHNVRQEILRVENAQADSRIEAEICRQLGGTSLLMLPIHRERVVAGVLEVIFGVEHAFEDREVRAYRLLAGLVEEAMERTAGVAELPEMPETIPQTIDEIGSKLQKYYGGETLTPLATPEPWVLQACAAAGGGSPHVEVSPKGASVAAAAEKNVFLAEVWRKATAAAAVGALVFISGVAYVHHTASSDTGTVLESSNPGGPPVLPIVSKPLPTLPASTRSATHLAIGQGLPGFTRKQIGPSEIDYVADDVTIRVFTQRRTVSAARRLSRQVKYGKDVTVRYFASEPVRLVTSPGDTSDRSPSVSK
jgi:GAF domain